MESIGVGFIGCGEIAVKSAEAVAQAQHVHLAMVHDIEASLAKDLGETHQTPYTSDLTELLENEDVHAVYIATPHYLHAPLAVAAAHAGKHVLCEKPLATTIDDAIGMIDECRKQSVQLSVAFVRRYDSRVLRARSLIQQGALGRVTGVRLASVGDKPESYWSGGYSGRAPSTWRQSAAESGGGMLIMNASHNIDAAYYLIGDRALRVFAEADTFNTDVEVEDTIAVVMRFSRGAIGTIWASSCMAGRRPPWADGDAVWGDNGHLVIGSSLRVFLREPTGDIPAGDWCEAPCATTARSSRAQLFDDFARALLQDRRPPITGADGLAALAVVVAAYQSAEAGEPVTPHPVAESVSVL